jgi:hypothetical protein
MHIYRAYLIGGDGHILNRIDLECDDDYSAKERAARFADGRDVELWHGARKVATFKHT